MCPFARLLHVLSLFYLLNQLLRLPLKNNTLTEDLKCQILSRNVCRPIKKVCSYNSFIILFIRSPQLFFVSVGPVQIIPVCETGMKSLNIHPCDSVFNIPVVQAISDRAYSHKLSMARLERTVDPCADVAPLTVCAVLRHVACALHCADNMQE